ncbi:MAG: tryptophan synthase subunit alpha [Candidatus Ratteibacteria bacterium]
MNIKQKFKLLVQENRVGLIIYVTAGYPDINFTEDFVQRLQDVGVDFIEIGVPFSDPVADGPIIQACSQKALENKVNLESIFNVCDRLKSRLSIPYLLMSYYNPVYQYGLEKFARDCAETNVSGVIVPDLPFEESRQLNTQLKKFSIDQILFISSTTSPERRKKILKVATGFIYYIAVHGVTGTRDFLPEETYQDVAQLREQATLPVAVGFGISNQQQILRLKRCADGIIIGSFVMKEIMDGNWLSLLETLKKFHYILKHG